jgi:hypothetical protein
MFDTVPMKKISVQGGAPVALCDAVRSFGASWGKDGNIILALATTATRNSPFAGYGDLWRVPEAGGAPEPVTNPAESGDKTHRWPQILPGGMPVANARLGQTYRFQDKQPAVARAHQLAQLVVSTETCRKLR